MVISFTVRGFKNLAPSPLQMGPLLGIAGLNGAGKSNLLDAFGLLRGLVTGTAAEAIRGVRGNPFSEGGGSIEFEVDFLVEPMAVDELGMAASATATFLRYDLKISVTDRGVKIEREDLTSIAGVCRAGSIRDRP